MYIYIVDASCRMHVCFPVAGMCNIAFHHPPLFWAHRAPFEWHEATWRINRIETEKENNCCPSATSCVCLGDLVWVRVPPDNPLLPDRYW